jgi:hypothetical protein
MKRRHGAITACLGAWLALFAACTDTRPPSSCGSVPPNGCPEDFGADVCQDPSCNATYACDDGRWSFVRMCGARDVTNAVGPAMDATEKDWDSGETADAPRIDGPPGASGGPACVPLQAPDCPLAIAASCAPSLDCCGCGDLFVCTDGGWDPWGRCVDGSVVRQ